MELSVVRVRVVSAGDRARAAWGEGRTFTLPQSVVERAGWHDRIDAAGNLRLSSDRVPLCDDDVREVREMAAFTDAAPLSARLPIGYNRAPGVVRALAARAIGRWQRGNADAWARFPAWPLDLTADWLADVIAAGSDTDGRATPVVLTHDIDSPEGLAALVRDFLPIEEKAGARSTSYVVPCGWTVDEALVADAHGRGHEIGVHGYDHANRTPFAGADERRRRLDAAKPFADRFGVSGYRAPSLLRTRPLLRDLASRYRYDSSIPTSGGLFPVPNNGCASARPFTVEGIVELPLSMPRDGSLRFLGYGADDIVRLWIECADAIAAARGVVVLLTHCERRFSGTPAMLRAYRTFVEHVAASPRFHFDSAAAAAKRDAA